MDMCAIIRILTLYSTICLFVSKLLRQSLMNRVHDIIYIDMPQVEYVLQLCFDIYLVRVSLSQMLCCFPGSIFTCSGSHQRRFRPRRGSLLQASVPASLARDVVRGDAPVRYGAAAGALGRRRCAATRRSESRYDARTIAPNAANVAPLTLTSLTRYVRELLCM